VYLDCNATAPIEPAVREAVTLWLADELGNAGSRTHEYGLRANRAVQEARRQVAAVVDADANEVIFTSGATESNNIAILGLAAYGEESGRRHIVSTAIEHKAALEPLEALEARGFSVTLLRPDETGAVSAESVKDALRPDTLLVSVMHANNETGAIQPLSEIANALGDHDAYFHVDAAQGYGKDLVPLRNKRIDLISVSGHKIYGPLGIGALVLRRRGFKRPPVKAIMFGGGQERGLAAGHSARPADCRPGRCGRHGTQGQKSPPAKVPRDQAVCLRRARTSGHPYSCSPGAHTIECHELLRPRRRLGSGYGGPQGYRSRF